MIRLKDLLVEASAGEEAKRRGLKSIGFGRYADPADPTTMVAKSVNGKLMVVKPQEQPQGKPQGNKTTTQPNAEPTTQLPKWFRGDVESKVANLSGGERKRISMQIDKLAELTQQAKEKGEKAPNFNLCKITVPGTNLYCDDNLGIPRDQMPQFKGKPVAGSPAANLPMAKDGEVDTEPLFQKMLKDKGIKVARAQIPSDALKATQTELVGAKVAGMAKALEANPNHPAITAPIYVSRDGYVIDGHHRWAAVTSNAIRDGRPTDMSVNIIDMDAKDIIPMANNFADKMGVATKKAASEHIKMKDLLVDLLTENILDLNAAQELAHKIDQEVDAPFVQSQVSTLGGQHRPSVMVKISLDPKSEWQNGIYQNSRYSQFHVTYDGVITQFSYYGLSKKFRKTRFKTAEDAVKKINDYISDNTQ